MNTFSFLSGVANLDRISFFIGLLLMGYAYTITDQLLKEYRYKKYLADQALIIEEHYTKSFDKTAKLYEAKFDLSVRQMDTYFKNMITILNSPMSESDRFKVGILQKEIERLSGEKRSLDELVQKKNKDIEESGLKRLSLQLEVNYLVEQMDKESNRFFSMSLTGLILFVIGWIGWKKAEKFTLKQRQVEMEIKELELKRIQREINPPAQTPFV